MDSTDVPASPTGGWPGRAGQPPGRGIQVEDLVKLHPGGKTAVDGVSFTVSLDSRTVN